MEKLSQNQSVMDSNKINKSGQNSFLGEGDGTVNIGTMKPSQFNHNYQLQPNTSNMSTLISQQQQKMSQQNPHSLMLQQPSMLNPPVSILNRNTKEDEEEKHFQQYFCGKTVGDFIINQRIGKGQFGHVVLAQHKLINENAAIKILDKNKIVEPRDHQRLEREIKIAKKVKHPFVIEDDNFVYLVIENCKADLQKVLKLKLKEEQACKYFQQIVYGVEYLHKMGIAHRDLKPQNILIDQYDNIKIIDFGLSNFYKKGDLLDSRCGSHCFAAPEMFDYNVNPKPYNGLYTDIWAVGLPFDDKQTQKLTSKIRKAEYLKPVSMNKHALDLIQKIFVREPNQRLDLDGIKASEFFNLYPIAPPKPGILDKSEIIIDEQLLTNIEVTYHYSSDLLREELMQNQFSKFPAIYHMLQKKNERKKQRIGTLKDLFSQSKFKHNNESKRKILQAEKQFLKNQPSNKSFQPYIQIKAPEEQYQEVPQEADQFLENKVNISLRSFQHQNLDYNKQLSFDRKNPARIERSGDYLKINQDNNQQNVFSEIPKIIEPKKNERQNPQLLHKMTSLHYESSFQSLESSFFERNATLYENQKNKQRGMTEIKRSMNESVLKSSTQLNQSLYNSKVILPFVRDDTSVISNTFRTHQNSQNYLVYAQSNAMPYKKVNNTLQLHPDQYATSPMHGRAQSDISSSIRYSYERYIPPPIAQHITKLEPIILKIEEIKSPQYSDNLIDSFTPAVESFRNSKSNIIQNYHSQIRSSTPPISKIQQNSLNPSQSLLKSRDYEQNDPNLNIIRTSGQNFNEDSQSTQFNDYNQQSVKNQMKISSTKNATISSEDYVVSKDQYDKFLKWQNMQSHQTSEKRYQSINSYQSSQQNQNGSLMMSSSRFQVYQSPKKQGSLNDPSSSQPNQSIEDQLYCQSLLENSASSEYKKGMQQSGDKQLSDQNVKTEQEFQNQIIEQNLITNQFNKEYFMNQEWYKKMFKTRVSKPQNLIHLQYFSNPNNQVQLKLKLQDKILNNLKLANMFKKDSNLSVHSIQRNLKSNSQESSQEREAQPVNPVRNFRIKKMSVTQNTSPTRDDYLPAQLKKDYQFFQSRQNNTRYASQKVKNSQNQTNKNSLNNSLNQGQNYQKLNNVRINFHKRAQSVQKDIHLNLKQQQSNKPLQAPIITEPFEQQSSIQSKTHKTLVTKKDTSTSLQARTEWRPQIIISQETKNFDQSRVSTQSTKSIAQHSQTPYFRDPNELMNSSQDSSTMRSINTNNTNQMSNKNAYNKHLEKKSDQNFQSIANKNLKKQLTMANKANQPQINMQNDDFVRINSDQSQTLQIPPQSTRKVTNNLILPPATQSRTTAATQNNSHNQSPININRNQLKGGPSQSNIKSKFNKFNKFNFNSIKQQQEAMALQKKQEEAQKILISKRRRMSN
eukprot:403345220